MTIKQIMQRFRNASRGTGRECRDLPHQTFGYTCQHIARGSQGITS